MNESKATRYQRAQRRADGVALAAGAAVLAMVALTPISRWLAGAVRAYGRGLAPAPHDALSLVLFALLVAALCQLAALTARLLVTRAADTGVHLRNGVVWLAVAVLGAAAVRVAVAVAGAWWWLAAGLLIAAGLVGAAHGVAPLVASLTRARALSRAGLSARLDTIARRAGVEVRAIEEIRAGDTAMTALVTGFGRSRRIFLAPDIVRDWSDDEIAVVVAHEIAHQANHDLARTLALDAVIIAAGLGVADVVLIQVAPQMGWTLPFDLAALPLVAGVAGAVWVASTPLRHAESRRQERLADAMALVLTGGAEAFGSALRRLGERRLAEERPSTLTRWLYHRHPSVPERLAMADAYKRSGTRR